MTDPAMRRTLATFEEKLGTNCRTTTDERKQEVNHALASSFGLTVSSDAECCCLKPVIMESLPTRH